MVFVVFGSLSDSATFAPVLEEFKKKRVPYIFHGLSAHKTPKELVEELKKTRAKIFVAGAGLSSALPGFVASQTIKPMIGIAVQKDFEGLDSLLSTLQMPPGVPVLAVGLQNPLEAAKHVENFLNRYSGITLIERKEKEAKDAFKKALEVIEQFGASYNTTFQTDYSKKTELFIDFVPFEQIKELQTTHATVIVVPLKKESKAADSLELIDAMNSHLWVGLNRAENAAIAAMQLMNLGLAFEQKLLNYRLEMKKKVLEQDKKEFEKWNHRKVQK